MMGLGIVAVVLVHAEERVGVEGETGEFLADVAPARGLFFFELFF